MELYQLDLKYQERCWNPFDEAIKMCTSVITAIINGRTMWKVKNRVKVAVSTENPPQIHCSRSVPIYGIAEKD